MILRKIVSFFLLPEGILLILLGVSVWAALRARVKVMKISGVAALTFYFLFSSQVAANLLLMPLEDTYPPLEIEKIDEEDIAAVVVLGGGTVPVSPEEGGLGSIAPGTQKRYVYGYRVARAAGCSIVVSGGSLIETEFEEPEAVVAKRFLQQLGMDGKEIITEIQSRTTKENAEYVKGILEAKGWEDKKIILVTSAYHMRRSVLTFNRAGLEVIPAPTDYLSDRVPLNIFFFIPNPQNLKYSSLAVKEYIGFIVYALGLG